MRKHNVHRARKAAAAPAVKPVPWEPVLLTLLCASVLAAGLFYAARQHFSTIDLGLKNSKLRKQVEDLESERRRLVLAKEVSMSPVNIARVSRELAHKGKPESAPAATQETAVVERREPSKTAPEPTQISMRESKRVAAIEQRPDVKKASKPSSGNAPERPVSPNERPRIVENEKRVASATVKSF